MSTGVPRFCDLVLRKATGEFSIPKLAGGVGRTDQSVYNWVRSNRWPRYAVEELCKVFDIEVVTITGHRVRVTENGTAAEYEVDGWINREAPSGHGQYPNLAQLPFAGPESLAGLPPGESGKDDVLLEFRGRVPRGVLALLMPYVANAELMSIVTPGRPHDDR